MDLKKKEKKQNDAYMSSCFDLIRLLCLLVVHAPEARRVCSKRDPLRTGGKKREAFHFKVTTFPPKMSQLQQSTACVDTLTYVAPMLRFQEVIFDRTNPRSEPLGVTLEVHGGSWCEWGLEVLMGLLHRASSKCNTLLPPKEGECDHVFISLTPRREPNPNYSHKQTEQLKISCNKTPRPGLFSWSEFLIRTKTGNDFKPKSRRWASLLKETALQITIRLFKTCFFSSLWRSSKRTRLKLQVNL